jgi:hypothetical protein
VERRKRSLTGSVLPRPSTSLAGENVGNGGGSLDQGQRLGTYPDELARSWLSPDAEVFPGDTGVTRGDDLEPRDAPSTTSS